MANRQWSKNVMTQARAPVDLTFLVSFDGSGNATMSTGDTNSAYVTFTKTGTGTYTIQTKDAFTGILGFAMDLQLATPAGNWNWCFGTPTHNSDNTYTFALNTYVGVAPTNITSGVAAFWLRLSNTGTTP